MLQLKMEVLKTDYCLISKTKYKYLFNGFLFKILIKLLLKMSVLKL